MPNNYLFMGSTGSPTTAGQLWNTLNHVRIHFKNKKKGIPFLILNDLRFHMGPVHPYLSPLGNLIYAGLQCNNEE